MNSSALFNAKDLTITMFSEDGDWEIDLEECATSAQMLDWIFQLQSMKNFAPALPQFLDCLEEACLLIFDDTPQGVFCPGGNERVVDWHKGSSLPKDL